MNKSEKPSFLYCYVKVGAKSLEQKGEFIEAVGSNAELVSRHGAKWFAGQDKDGIVRRVGESVRRFHALRRKPVLMSSERGALVEAMFAELNGCKAGDLSRVCAVRPSCCISWEKYSKKYLGNMGPGITKLLEAAVKNQCRIIPAPAEKAAATSCWYVCFEPYAFVGGSAIGVQSR